MRKSHFDLNEEVEEIRAIAAVLRESCEGMIVSDFEDPEKYKIGTFLLFQHLDSRLESVGKGIDGLRTAEINGDGKLNTEKIAMAQKTGGIICDLIEMQALLEVMNDVDTDGGGEQREKRILIFWEKFFPRAKDMVAKTINNVADLKNDFCKKETGHD